MKTPKGNAFLPFAIRIIEVVFLVVAAALVGIGRGICVTVISNNNSRVDCSAPNADITTWKDAKDVNLSKIRGQYFVFAISVILALMGIFSLVFMLFKGKRSKTYELGYTGIAVAGCFACGCLEAWYASDHGVLIEPKNFDCPTDNCTFKAIVKTWAAASALYFFGFFIFIGDTILTARTKRKHKQQIKRPIVATTENAWENNTEF